MKHILITGATGFSGSHLARYLFGKDYRITGTYYEYSHRHKKTPYPLLRLDVTDAAAVGAAIKRLRPDAVFHLAALAHPKHCRLRPRLATNANVKGTLSVLEGIRVHRPAAKLVFVSTSYVYGRTLRSGKAVSENDKAFPVEPYGYTKAMAELACLDYYSRFGIKVIIARAFNHVGAGQSPEYVFSDWAHQIAKLERSRPEKGSLKVGNLMVKREFLHIKDVVRAYDFLLRRGKPGCIYNICTGKPYLLRNVAQRLCGKSKRKISIDVQSQRLRKEPMVMKGNPARLRRLGWRPVHSPIEAAYDLLDEARRMKVLS